MTQEESRTAEDHLYVVEGMQFDRGYISPYFVTDPERMVRPLQKETDQYLVLSCQQLVILQGEDSPISQQ